MTELVLGLRPLPLVVSKHLRVLREAGRVGGGGVIG